jgi:PAS domain S-box-containing protein
MGDRWMDTIHPEDLPGVLAGYRAALDEQRDFEIEFRVERAGGGHAWVISRGTARIDIDRGFLGYVGALHDVTARRRAEEALRCREPEGVARPGMMLWVTDAAGRLGFASRDWLSFTGRAPADELGDGWLTSVHPGDRHRVGQTVAAAAAEGLEMESVHRMRREDGEYRWVRMAGAPRAASDGTRAGLVGHCEDVTARRCDAHRDAAVTRLVDLLADGVGLPPFANALAEEAGALLGAARVEIVMFHSDDAHVVVGAWTRLDAPGDDAPLGCGGAEWSALVQGDDSSTHDPGRSWGAIRVARAGLLDPSPDERSLLTAFAEILGLAVATAEVHRSETPAEPVAGARPPRGQSGS